mmetsp:Transcript_139529/g.256618  ORF Transcript_139529/g.256618 Transcript_139529/m.256618 type:complete len:1261 (-) Transcript_139529:86-3868(-)
MSVSPSPQPPFAVSADFQSLPPPPLESHNLRVETALRPSYNILSLAELQGSPYLLSGDGKGFISAWDVVSNTRRTDDPEHYFEAHSGPVNDVISLRSGRLPELVEEYEWPRGDAGAKRQAFHIGERRALESEAESEVPGRPGPSPRSEATGEPIMVDWEEEEPQPKGFCGGLADKLCCCRRSSLFGPGRNKAKHWLIATASEDGTVRVWRWRLIPTKHADVVPFEVDFITEWASDGDVPILRCMELYDGHLCLVLQGSADVLIMDPGSCVVKWVLYGHTGPVTSITQCPDGRLVTGAQDGSVRLWVRNSWGDSVTDEKDAPPAVAWADPEQEMAKSGVSSMAFFAHTQQAQKGEYVTVCTRTFVHRAENLPKADLFSASDPYLTCTIVDGVPGYTEAQTPAVKQPFRWNFQITLTLRKQLMDGKWQLPESALLDFEVYGEGGKIFTETHCLARWSISLETVLSDIQRDPGEASRPQPRKLYAPAGEGPFQDLKDATINVGFIRSNEHTLDCIIESAEGLVIAARKKCYVRVQYKSKLEGRSETRRLTSQVRAKTATINNNNNPVWNEVLEIKVPACHQESKFVYGPDLYLHFEVYDSDAITKDDLLGTLAIPFHHVLNKEGQGVKPYELDLAQAFRNKKKGKKDAGAGPPTLHLGFEILTPCPVQLRCYVERAQSLVPMQGPTSVPIVRIRCVESDPLVPQTTAYRTETKYRTINPVWNELSVFRLPVWHWKNAQHLLPASVRASWEHPSQQPQVVICAEVYDHGIIGSDSSLGRCVIALETAATLANDPRNRRAVPFDLVDSNGSLSSASPAHLYLGFEPGHADGELVVKIEKAERLPTHGDVSADPYVIVKVSELGAFGQPSHQVESKNWPIHATGEPANMSQTDPVWQQEELLDLPGAEYEDLIAVRPNWFIHFDVVDLDEGLRKEESLMQAVVPISEVLTELAEAGRPQPTPDVIQSRIDTLKGATLKQQVQEMKPPYVMRDMELIPSKFGVRPTQGASDRVVGKAGGAKKREGSPAAKIARGFEGLIKSVGSLGSSIMSRSSSRGSRDGSPKGSPKALRDAGAGESYPGTEDQPGYGSGVELGKGSIGNSRLIVRFQAIQRWIGSHRDRKKPLPRPLKASSPVTSLMTLGSRIVAGYENGNVYVWDTSNVSSVPLHQFEAHRVPVSGIAYLPALDCLVTTALSRTREEAGTESLVKLWKVSTLELRQVISLHSASTRCVLHLSHGSEARKGSPAVALATETRQSKLIQILSMKKD